MNSPTRSSIPSGTRFAQNMADQRPRYDNRRIFRRKLRRGRPARNDKKQYWLR